jgi:hypothetical protein
LANVYLALIHYPVYNKRGDIVTTCITGFDLHDIARSAVTFGVKRYFVVNPLPTQQEFAKRIYEFWLDETSLEFNWTRAEAFKLIRIIDTLEATIAEITRDEGQRPKVIATSARPVGNVTFESLKLEIGSSSAPYLILLGTGWGMTKEVLDQADTILAPINGNSDYNHLSVRSACAIILDRLLGK